MSGGVRNLRAMFENKEESSAPPPDRGRSPAGSIGGGSNGTSPRPLSKVRTSFVAVERSGQLGGQWGLRKENSAEPSLAARRTSFSIDEETDPKAIADRKESINSELALRKSSTAITEIIPETAVETPPVESEKRSEYLNGQGKIFPLEAKRNRTPDKKPLAEEQNPKTLQGKTANNAGDSGSIALKIGGGLGEHQNGSMSEKVKPTSPHNVTAKKAPAGRNFKPGPISTAPSSSTTKAAPKATKSPSNPKTPTTPAKTPTFGKLPAAKPTASSTSKAQTKVADMKVVKSTSSSATKSKPVIQPEVPPTTATMIHNDPTHILPATGFNKPKPKSPTRPAKLPASMTAPTASSLSKVTAAAAPSRQSPAPTNKTVSRSRSYASLSQKQEVHSKSSKPSNERPALGRPSSSLLKKQPSRQSLPKHTVQVEESFLARMMRPTTSSASKTTEKSVTPPRLKTNTRPTTRDGSGGHKLHQALDGSPSFRKLPTATKATVKEDSNMVQSDGAMDTTIPVIGISRPKPVSTEKTEPTIPVNTEDGLAVGSPHENNNPKGLAEGVSTEVAPVPVYAVNGTVDVKEPIEKPINDENLKLEKETLESTQKQENVEKMAVPKASENGASIGMETDLQSEALVENEEPKDIGLAMENPSVLEPSKAEPSETEPFVAEPGEAGEYEVMEDIVQGVKDEPEA